MKPTKHAMMKEDCGATLINQGTLCITVEAAVDEKNEEGPEVVISSSSPYDENTDDEDFTSSSRRNDAACSRRRDGQSKISTIIPEKVASSVYDEDTDNEEMMSPEKEDEQQTRPSSHQRSASTQIICVAVARDDRQLDGQNNQGKNSGDSTLDTSNDQEADTMTKDDNMVVVIVYDGAEQKEVLKLKCTDSVSTLTNDLKLKIKFDYLTLNNPKGNGWCDIHPETTVGEIANMTDDEENVIKATARVVNWIPDISTDNATDASNNGVAMIRDLQQQFDSLYKTATFFKNNCFLANGNSYTLLRLYKSVRTHALRTCQQIELREQSPTNLAIYFFDLAAAISKFSSCPFYGNDVHVAFAEGWKSVLHSYIISSCTVNNSPPVAVDKLPPVKRTKQR
jgi:hypothetical protein